MAPASQLKLYTNLATRGGIVEWCTSALCFPVVALDTCSCVVCVVMLHWP